MTNKENQEVEENELIPQPQNLRKRSPAPREYAGAVTIASEDVGSMDSSRAEFKKSQFDKFLDERGDPTYYYQNISQGKIHISDLDGITIDTGAPIDLLDLADEEKVLKSKNLRGITRPLGERGVPMLKRLTPTEFQELYDKWIRRRDVIRKQKEDKQKLLSDAEKNPKEIKKLSSKSNNQELDIRAQLQGLVEKLRVGNLDVNGKEAEEIVRGKIAGITPDEFIMKIEVMKLTRDEVDYVYQTVMDKQVRKAVQEMYQVED